MIDKAALESERANFSTEGISINHGTRSASAKKMNFSRVAPREWREKGVTVDRDELKSSQHVKDWKFIWSASGE